MMRWVRLVLPPWYTIAVVAGLYLLGELFYTTFRSLRDEDAHMLRDLVLLATGLAYGLFRVIAFHPVYRPEYRKWLLTVPWHAGKPLPLGPIALQIQDVLLLGLLVGLGWYDPHIDPLRIPLLFLVAYLVLLAITFWPSGLWPQLYAVVFGIGLVARLWDDTLPALMAAAATYGVAYLGLRRSLARLTSDAETYNENLFCRWLGLSTSEKAEMKFRNLTGWPFDALRPHAEPMGIPHSHGVMISLLCGWWTFALIAGLYEQIGIADMPSWRKNELVMMIGFLSQAAAFPLIISRLGLYLPGHSSPINFWGRLFTFRWIIPAYDRVFVAPLCIIAVQIAGLVWLILNKEFLVLIVPATVSAMIFCALNIGPTRHNWRLTAPARLAATAAGKDKRYFIEV